MKFVEGRRTWRRVLRQLAVALGHDLLTAQHRAASHPHVPDQLHINQISVKWGPLDLPEPAECPAGHRPPPQLCTLLRAAQMG